MKNMKKLLQRAMVFTLTAAMLVGTPMTASAAGLVDLYSISDGEGFYDGRNNPVETGTITNTDTYTGFLIESNRANIVGIALDKDIIHAEKGEKETLKATVVLDKEEIITTSDIVDDGRIVAKAGTDIKDLIVKEMSKKIHWVVMYPEKLGKMPNPAEKVSISGNSVDRSEITLLPRQGTEAGKEVIVRASIDASYYYAGKEEGERYSESDKIQVVIEQDSARISDKPYTAEATVSVKEYTEGLTWSDTKTATGTTNPLYVKHTLDLSSKLVRDPKTANDAITWTSQNTKVATVSATGVVTAKKAGEAEITAVSEHGALATRTITVDDGTKASKVEIVTVSNNSIEKAITRDIADPDDESTRELAAVTYAKADVAQDAEGKVLVADTEEAAKALAASLGEGNVKVKKNYEMKNGQWYVTADKQAAQVDVTDVIDWTSNKTAVASVTAAQDQIGGGEAVVNLNGVGKAVITAKASNGKSAKITVNVKASLQTLAIGSLPAGNKVYSGQSIQLTAKRNPTQNNDAVKWTVTAADGVTKTKDASINAKGVLKIANKVTDGTKIKVTLAHNKKGTNVADAAVELTLVQSSIDGITVLEGTTPVAKVEVNESNGKLVQTIPKADNTSNISVPLSKTYTATVTGDKLGNLDQAELLTWKTSSAKVAALSGGGKSAKITAVGPGKATITVSGIRVVNGKASVISTKFTVQVKQPVTTLTMNKPTVTLAEKIHKTKGTQDQKVALKVTFGPKKADKSQTKIASWTVQKDGGTPITVTDRKGTVQKASVSIPLNAPKAGEVYKITAKSITGATATSTVTIVAPTTAVAIGKGLKDGAPDTYPKNATEMKIGKGTITLKSFINVGSKNEPKWVTAGSDAAKQEKAENVTYSVNKKGIVTVDSNGKVYAVKKGVVTITAKTPTGKKATLKVTVQ